MPTKQPGYTTKPPYDRQAIIALLDEAIFTLTKGLVNNLKRRKSVAGLKENEQWRVLLAYIAQRAAYDDEAGKSAAYDELVEDLRRRVHARSDV